MTGAASGPSRRGLLAGAGGALVLGVCLPALAGPRRRAAFAPNAWLSLSPDETVTVVVEKPELGQGAWTYVAMMVAEELEVPLASVSVVQAPTEPKIYKNLRTGGSGGVVASFLPMRRAGAQAREMLITAAARRWRVDRGACAARDGAVVHVASGRRLTYGALAAAAARLTPPAPDAVRLKPAAEFKLLGRPQPRLDAPAKVDGRAVFGADVRPPGLLFAVIARCPVFGGRLKSFDAAAAKAAPGVRAVFPVPPLPRRFNTAGGVAVVADTTWAAIRGREALRLEWEPPSGEPETSQALWTQMTARAAGPASYVAVSRGDAAAALKGAVRTLEADYASPFQAHATMEPMNTTAHVRPGEVELWSPTQFAAEVQAAIAGLAGLPADRVIVHTTLSGGSFGRRYQWDAPAEAWQVAKAMAAPVQLVWTREDDLQHDFYRPANLQRLRAGLDAAGRPVGWTNRIVTTPIAASNLYTNRAETPQALADPAVVAELEWFGSDPAPYAIPDVTVDYAPADSRAPRSWWRGVSSSFTPFAKECFLDELAEAAGVDPLAYRLRLLEGGGGQAERLARVLRLAAEKAGWGGALPHGEGRGIAGRAGESVLAACAEVAVGDDGRVRVRRVVTAVDCGLAVNPDGVRAMMEGGVAFALSAVLSAEITLQGGAVAQGNFHDYPVLRLPEAPEVETHIVESDAPPGGVGELACMVTPPAVVNAVFAASGKRVRRLPIAGQLRG